ncbi:hypothetical protein [Thalassococcus lentus]|uniref:Uncharacterized protein n=1 Tax=Thalassococcus lentus TaxID=1210524 RepID=A0ABT4XQI0_9RHOB|nr:hypothetical protein [Thalassococcus lentus]MDA7424204.1 hypothetical protein [Thalassococcus lentus]
MKKGDATDPKGLIADAYRIEGITSGECRSIFLDWALSLPVGADTNPLIAKLLTRHPEPDHPMTAVLIEGQKAAGPAKRRGGRAARVMQ